MNLHLVGHTEDGRREPLKLSALMLEFAAPLLHLNPGGPRDMHEFRYMLQLAALCWNAPVYAARGEHLLMRSVEGVLSSAPPEIASRMREMLVERMDRHGHLAFPVVVKVGGTLEKAHVTATGYVPAELAAQASSADTNDLPVDDTPYADPYDARSVFDDDPSFGPALPPEPFHRASPKVGANERCPCGSGLKYKRCCRAREMPSPHRW